MCMSQSTSHSFLLGLIHFFYVSRPNYNTTMLSTRTWIEKGFFFQFRRHFLTNRIYARHYKNISTYECSTYSALVNVSHSREVVTYFMMFHLVICNASYTKLSSSRRKEKLWHIWDKNCFEQWNQERNRKARKYFFLRVLCDWRWKIDLIFWQNNLWLIEIIFYRENSN